VTPVVVVVVEPVPPEARPKPPQLDQKKIEVAKPTIPTISRMIPIVWILTPLTVALTAQIRTAPTAAKIRLKLIPIFFYLRLQCMGEAEVQTVDPRLEKKKTTIATTRSRKRNFEMTMPPPIASTSRTTRSKSNIPYLPFRKELAVSLQGVHRGLKRP
jgi:hypothetical protein